MRFLFVVLLILLTSCSDESNSHQEKDPAYIGMLFLGMTSSNSESVRKGFFGIQSASTFPATAFLYSSFGSDFTTLNIYLDKFKDLSLWVGTYLDNGAGRRNIRLGPADLLPDLSVKELNHLLEVHDAYVQHSIEQHVLDILSSLQSLPRSHRYTLSLGLESNYSEKAALEILKIVQQIWPYQISYNPIDGDCSYMPESIYCETHGLNATAKRAKCILNADGHDSGPFGIPSAGNAVGTLEEVQAFVKRGRDSGCITLLWSAELQGISDTFVPTLERQFTLHQETIDFFRNIIQVDQ